MGRLSDFKPQLMSGIQRRWIMNVLGVSLLLIFAVLSAFAIALSNYYYSSMTASLEGRATTYASFISKSYLTSYDDYYRSITTLAYEFKDSDKFELQFISSGRRLQVTTNNVGVGETYPAAGLLIDTADVKNTLANGTTNQWIGPNTVTGERVMAVSSPLALPYGNDQVFGVVRCVTSLERVDSRILQWVGLSALTGVLFIFLMLVTNLLFIRGILIPVQEINMVSKRIAEGGYGVKIEKTYRDEMGELVDNINHMSSEIRAAERMKSDFISSVSHELRTPLTAINGWGETLLSSDMSDPSEIKKGLRIMLKETSRLSKMVEELLEFTRMEGGRMTLNIEPFDLTADLEEIIYLHMDAFKRDGITLSYQQSDEIPEVNGDRARLKQVFINILDNAAKHGGGGKRIDASLICNRPWLDIVIRDYGSGIPENELPHVKYKFYKGSSSARGSGIGLSVSDEIVRLHGGELLIESTEGEGTTVTVRLPCGEEKENSD